MNGEGDFEMIKDLPRFDKDTNLEDYTNDEVRTALYWCKVYYRFPGLLILFHPYVYYQWLDYKHRVNGANFYYWLVCYAFGI